MCSLQRAFHLVMEAENRMSTGGVAGNMASHGLHATPAHWMSNGGTKQYQYEVIAPNSRCGTILVFSMFTTVLTRGMGGGEIGLFCNSLAVCAMCY